MSALHVGNIVDKESYKVAATSIIDIFKFGHEYRMDQETIRLALELLPKVSEISDITISNCNFDVGEK